MQAMARVTGEAATAETNGKSFLDRRSSHAPYFTRSLVKRDDAVGTRICELRVKCKLCPYHVNIPPADLKPSFLDYLLYHHLFLDHRRSWHEALILGNDTNQVPCLNGTCRSCPNKSDTFSQMESILLGNLTHCIEKKLEEGIEQFRTQLFDLASGRPRKFMYGCVKMREVLLCICVSQLALKK